MLYHLYMPKQRGQASSHLVVSTFVGLNTNESGKIKRNIKQFFSGEASFNSTRDQLFWYVHGYPQICCLQWILRPTKETRLHRKAGLPRETSSLKGSSSKNSASEMLSSDRKITFFQLYDKEQLGVYFCDEYLQTNFDIIWLFAGVASSLAHVHSRIKIFSNSARFELNDKNDPSAHQLLVQ
jgi:hypothetical protein